MANFLQKHPLVWTSLELVAFFKHSQDLSSVQSFWNTPIHSQLFQQNILAFSTASIGFSPREQFISSTLSKSQAKRIKIWQIFYPPRSCIKCCLTLETINDKCYNHTHYIGPTRLLAAASTLSESLVHRTTVKFTYKRAVALEIGIAVALIYTTFFLIRAAGICIVAPSRWIAFKISRGLAKHISTVYSFRTLALRFQYNI